MKKRHEVSVDRDADSGTTISASCSCGDRMMITAIPHEKAEDFLAWWTAQHTGPIERLFHRSATPIPTDPAERKRRVQWVLGHRLWEYPVNSRAPAPGHEDDRFKPVLGKPGITEWVSDGPDWIDTVVLLGSFHECSDIDFVYVDPVTEKIEEDDSRNTAGRVWIEAGGWMDRSTFEHEMAPADGWNDHNKWVRSHDIELDCGGPDFEMALLELSSRVELFYGESEERRTDPPRRCEGRFLDKNFEQYESGCTSADDGYCERCGFDTRKVAEMGGFTVTE